jgi:hypothetical protein
MATSAANPVKLRSYSDEGLSLVDALTSKATAVVAAVQALEQTRTDWVPLVATPHVAPVPASGDIHTRLRDLTGDWRHLDEFVGDVAAGFFRADLGRNGVVSIDDERLGRLGRVGYADRDEAIAAARNMAAEYRRLRRQGHYDVDDIRILVMNMAGTGQYDPAFAVELARQVGARGFADMTSMIRSAYSQNGMQVPPEGIAAVQVLSNTLTTALDTLPDVPDADRHDPDNRGLPPDERLGADFVHDLTTGLRLPHQEPPGSGPTEGDLSVLLRLAEPPTAVAVAIANDRMTRRMQSPVLPDGGDSSATSWGRYGGVVTNYATMLARDPDAAAQWLRDGENTRLALGRSTAGDVDGGAALADVVEAGVTHPEADVRRGIMQQAIVEVGQRNLEMTNPHLRPALASGVEQNMGLIDRNVNRGWLLDSGGQHRPDGSPELANTASFLAEVMEDGGARDRVQASAVRYIGHDLGGLPIDDAGMRNRTDVHESGRILRIVTQGDIDQAAADFQRETSWAKREGKLIDFAIGRVPYLGPAHEVAAVVVGESAGELGTNPDDATLKRELRNISVEMVNRVGGLDMSPRDKDSMRAGAEDVEIALGY